MQNADIANEISLKRQHGSRILDFCDGTTYTQHTLFSSEDNALQIVAYYDELEVCNPIGAYVKKHKLGCIFFSIGNIRPRYRSSLKSIFLVAVGKYVDIEEYGIDAFLRPFVEDLKVLYCDGIQVQNSTYYGALLAFLADTKAAHLLGGFKESMSFANRICRSCMATTTDVQSCIKESDCILRTPEVHFDDCQKLTGQANDPHSVRTGINRLSILEEVPEFSVVNGLPHDIMHDLFEGVVNYELKYFMSYCLDQKYFSIAEFNQRVSNFDFGDRDKPATIDRTRITDPEKKIRQSAGQMISLILYLPVIVGDKIPQENENWHSILVLVKICQIALSWCYSADTATYFRVLVEEKLSLLRRLYSSITLKPKMHYLVHYASQMERFGPLINTWTMRHEAKLSFIKRSSRRGNFKNICKTVARHHQLWFCYQSNVETHLLYTQPDRSTVVKESNFFSESDYIQKQLRKSCSILPSSLITHHNWLKIQSTKHKIGSIILLEWTTLSPKFGRVNDILHCEGKDFLLVELFSGDWFNAHYNAYVVVPSAQIQLVCTDELFDHYSLQIRKSFDKTEQHLYICMSYIPCE